MARTRDWKWATKAATPRGRALHKRRLQEAGADVAGTDVAGLVTQAVWRISACVPAEAWQGLWQDKNVLWKDPSSSNTEKRLEEAERMWDDQWRGSKRVQGTGKWWWQWWGDDAEEGWELRGKKTRRVLYCWMYIKRVFQKEKQGGQTRWGLKNVRWTDPHRGLL